MSPLDRLREIAEGLDCGELVLHYNASLENWTVLIYSCTWREPFRWSLPDPFDERVSDLHEAMERALGAFLDFSPDYTPGNGKPWPG